MQNQIIALIILIVCSAAGYLLRIKKFWKSDILKDLVVVWAAAMIWVSIIHIFPEVTATLSIAPFIFMGGFLLIYLLENAFMVHACVEHDCHFHNTSILSWVAILVHTIFDWVAIAAAFTTGGTLGWTVLAGVVIHQIPVSISLVGLLHHSSFTRKIQNMLMMFFVLAAPIGFIGSNLLFSHIPETIVAGILAFSGWSLLYLGASDILPNVHKKTANHQLVAALFLLTLIIVAGAKFFE